MKNAPAQEKDSDEKFLRLSRAIDEFAGYANSHGLLVANLSAIVAQKFQLSPYDILTLRQAALVHDIGELVMNRDYIKAARKLRADELSDIRRHPVIGEQESAKRGFSRAAQLLVRWHHEWWNGAGYPDGLSRENIPLTARILRVADTFSALLADRPFRPALPEAEARQHLIEWSGIEFDPQIVLYFLESDISEILK